MGFDREKEGGLLWLRLKVDLTSRLRREKGRMGGPKNVCRGGKTDLAEQDRLDEGKRYVLFVLEDGSGSTTK